MSIVPGLAIAAILWLFWLTKPWDKIINIVAILAAASLLYLARVKLRRQS